MGLSVRDQKADCVRTGGQFAHRVMRVRDKYFPLPQLLSIGMLCNRQLNLQGA